MKKILIILLALGIGTEVFSQVINLDPPVDRALKSDTALYAISGGGTMPFDSIVGLQDSLNLKLNIGDTSSMLSPYFKTADTITLSNRIDAKADTTDLNALELRYETDSIAKNTALSTKATWGGDNRSTGSNYLGMLGNRSMKLGIDGADIITFDSINKTTSIGLINTDNTFSVNTTNTNYNFAGANKSSILRLTYSSSENSGVFIENTNTNSATSGGSLVLSQSQAGSISGTRLGVISFAGRYGGTVITPGNATSIQSFSTQMWSQTGPALGGRLSVYTRLNSGLSYERFNIDHNGKIGLSNGDESSAPTSPTYNLSFAQGGNAIIGMEATTAVDNGYSMTLRGSNAKSGVADALGGNAFLSTGTSNGVGSADAGFLTPTPTSGTTANAPVNREMVMTRILADNGSFTLNAGRSGMAWITFGDGEEYAWFSFTTAAVVTLITNSANVTTTATTDNSLNIYDGGTAVTIENTFSDTKVMTVKVIYNL